MIQDNVPICPRCQGALRKVQDVDTNYICVNSVCKTVLKVIDRGQSERELKCQIII